MADGDRQLAFTTGPLPVSVQVSGADQLTPKAVNASFDGTGAGSAFLPCLIITGRTGHEVARIPGPQIAAGASAEVSWFPRVGGSGDGDGWKFDTDNEGGWGLVVANDTGPNGYSLQFDTGSSDAPIGITNDGGLVVDTAGAVVIDGGSGVIIDPGGNNLDLSGRRIINGADGIAASDFATVGQIGAGGVTDVDGISGSVNLVAGTNVSIADNSPSPGDITISATGGGGGGGELDYVERATSLTVTATSEATAQTFITGASVGYDGVTRVKVEVWIALASASGGTGVVSLFEDGATLGWILQFGDGTDTTLYGTTFITPTAGAHTLTIRAWKTGGAVSLTAKSRATKQELPAWYRITPA